MWTAALRETGSARRPLQLRHRTNAMHTRRYHHKPDGRDLAIIHEGNWFCHSSSLHIS